MTTNRPVNGQDIGQAHYATRAVLERLLTGIGLQFETSVALNLVGNAASAPTEAELAGQLEQGLKISPQQARGILSQLTDQGLTSTDGSEVNLTPTGRARVAQVRDGLAEITGRLYGDLPAGDLIVAQRVLASVTERANAELAG
jgi:hypothetical protein